MAGPHEDAQARRVVTGEDESERSTVVFDDVVSSRLASAGNTKCDIWRIGALPARIGDWDGLDAGVLTSPAPTGLVYRVVTVPPDTAWDMKVGYRDANGPLPGMIGSADIPGLHFTDTVDIVTVLRGEMVAVLETTETVLRVGDTLVQRGTNHAWNNRTDQPAVIVSLMYAAVR